MTSLRTVTSLDFPYVNEPFRDEIKKVWQILLLEPPQLCDKKRVPQAKHGYSWLVETFTTKHAKKYEQYFTRPDDIGSTELPTFSFWYHRIPEIEALLAYKKSTPNNVAKQQYYTEHGVTVQLSSIRQFKTKITIFLNYMLVSYDWDELPSTLREVMTRAKVQAYIEALADPAQFGHVNAQTIRAYIDVLIFVMRWADMGYVFLLVESVLQLELKRYILGEYDKYSKLRDMQLKERKSIAFLSSQGNFLEMDKWVEFFRDCIRTCKAYLFGYNELMNIDDEDKEEQAEEYLARCGKVYHDCFAIVLMLLTYFNRPEMYYQGQLQFLKLFYMTPPTGPPFYQYAYVFRGPEKVMRPIDTSTFAFGIDWTSFVYFYKHHVYPAMKTEDTDALFLNHHGKGISITRSDRFLKIVKRVAVGFTGIAFTCQDLRFHGNAHYKLDLNLTAIEQLRLDKATNHTSMTAEKYYQYTGQLEANNIHGSTIINKFLSYSKQSLKKISDTIKQKLSKEQYKSFLVMLQDVPELQLVLKQYDAEINEINESIQHDDSGYNLEVTDDSDLENIESLIDINTQLVQETGNPSGFILITSDDEEFDEMFNDNDEDTMAI